VKWHNIGWVEVIFSIVAVGLFILVMASCTPAQRDWRTNTSIDIGAGTPDTDPGYVYGYVGASYWLDYGVSVTAGAWRTVEPYWGPYLGINYSWVPFDE
jgi:hypothetical protein